MQYTSALENLDEDGYTQLNFNSRDFAKRPVVQEKGIHAASPSWRLIAVAVGILFLVTLIVAAVLGALAFWRSNSERNAVEKDNSSRSKDTQKPTKSSLDKNMAPSEAPRTTGIFSKSCPPNWTIHGESCYLFSISQDSWHESKTRCSQLGSSLLKIDNSKEFEFIKSQVYPHAAHSFWIGLSRLHTEGPWLWEDGSTFSYSLFQIRNTAPKESSLHNCAWIHGSEIYNQICNTPSLSICEKQL